MGYNQTMFIPSGYLQTQVPLALRKLTFFFYLRSISKLYSKRELVGTIRMLEIAVPISH